MSIDFDNDFTPVRRKPLSELMPIYFTDVNLRHRRSSIKFDVAVLTANVSQMYDVQQGCVVYELSYAVRSFEF